MYDKEVKRVLEKIKSIENMVGNPQYDLDSYQSYQINIKVDNSIPHGLFKPDPKVSGQYLASGQTFQAMKKDIFAVSDPDDLREPYQCKSCRTDLDKQFWHFCPMCGEQFIKDN